MRKETIIVQDEKGALRQAEKLIVDGKRARGPKKVEEYMKAEQLN